MYLIQIIVSGSLVHPSSHTHSLYNSLYPGYSYPQQKLQPSPPPPAPHNRTTSAHCWPSSHSVTDILAGVHAAAFRGSAGSGHPPGTVPGSGPGSAEHTGSPQNYNYYMYLQSGNTAMAAAHVAVAGMGHAHHGLATGSPI